MLLEGARRNRAKHQHWVPQFNPRYFATPESRDSETPQVRIFTKKANDGDEQLTNVRNVCGKRYLYALTRIHARFDAAAFFFGLSYFDNVDAAKVLAQLHQVLMPEASFVLATVAGDPTLTGAQATPTGDKVFSFYRNEADIVHLLTAAGFKIEGSAVVSSPSDASVRSNDVVLWGKRE